MPVPAEEVLELEDVFNDCFQNTLDVKYTTTQLWKQITQQSDQTYKEFDELLLRSISAAKGLPFARVSHFLARLVKSLPAKDTRKSRCQTWVEQLLEQLLSEYSCLKLALQRQRALQCIVAIVESVTWPMPGELAAKAVTTLADRLHDSQGKIRILAAQALHKINSAVPHAASPSVSNDVKEALLERLECETSKEVRAEIIQHLPVDEDTLPQILEFCADESEEVRAAVFTRLGAVPIAQLSGEEMAMVVRRGLKDAAAQDQAAAERLVGSWFRACEHDLVALLQKMDIDEHADEADATVHVLLKTHTSEVREMLKKHSGPRDLLKSSEKITPEQAYTWRVVCQYLLHEALDKCKAAVGASGAAASVEASRADGYRKVVEDFLPESAQDACSLILDLYSAGPDNRRAAAEVLKLAASCMDWADPPSRASATSLLDTLVGASASHEEQMLGDSLGSNPMAMVSCGGSGAWEAAVLALAAKIYPGARELTEFVLESGQMVLTMDLLEVSLPAPRDWQQGLVWLHQLLAVVDDINRGPIQAISNQGRNLNKAVDLLATKGLGCEDADVRQWSVRCLGQFVCLTRFVDSLANVSYHLTKLLRTDKDLNVRLEAINGLSGMMMYFGADALDAARDKKARMEEGGAGAEDAAERAGAAEDMEVDEADAAGAPETSDQASAQQEGGHEAAARDPASPDQGPSSAGEAAARPAAAAHESLSVLQLMLTMGSEAVVELEAAAHRNAMADDDEENPQDGDALQLLQEVIQALGRVILYQEPLEMVAQRHTHEMTTPVVPSKDKVVVQVLSKLLVWWHTPAVSDIPELNSCFTAIVQEFSRRGGKNRGWLYRAVLSGARQALALHSPDEALKVLGTVGCILENTGCTPRKSPEADAQSAECQAAAITELQALQQLCLMLLMEIRTVGTARPGGSGSKQYVQGLAKLVLLQDHVYKRGLRLLQRMLELNEEGRIREEAEEAEQLARRQTQAVLQRGIASAPANSHVAIRLEELRGQLWGDKEDQEEGEEAMSTEEVEQLEQELQAQLQELEPLPEEDEEEPAGPAGRKPSGRAAGTKRPSPTSNKRRSKLRVAKEEDEDEDEAEQDVAVRVAAPPRRQPGRAAAARTKERLAATSVKQAAEESEDGHDDDQDDE